MRRPARRAAPRSADARPRLAARSRPPPAVGLEQPEDAAARRSSCPSPTRRPAERLAPRDRRRTRRRPPCCAPYALPTARSPDQRRCASTVRPAAGSQRVAAGSVARQPAAARGRRRARRRAAVCVYACRAPGSTSPPSAPPRRPRRPSSPAPGRRSAATTARSWLISSSVGARRPCVRRAAAGSGPAR